MAVRSPVTQDPSVNLLILVTAANNSRRGSLVDASAANVVADHHVIGATKQVGSERFIPASAISEDQLRHARRYLHLGFESGFA